MSNGATHPTPSPRQLRRIGFRFWLCAVFVVLFHAPLAHVAAAQGRSAADVVYVESNLGIAGENSLFAFRRGADGSLTPIPGSPFRTGGTGVFDTTLALGPFDSDQNIITNEQGTLLFAVNSGSNTIAVFNILPDGALRPVQNSPFPSGGVNPVSVGLAGNTLTVVNKNQDINQNAVFSLPNYTTFRVTARGALIPISNGTLPLAQGSSPSQALISPDRRFVFGADFLGGLLQSIALEPSGRLTPNIPQGLPASEFLGSTAPRLPLGLAVHPRHPLLYVGFVTINRLGIYSYNAKGALTFVDSVPVSGQAICWVRTNQRGTRLYAVNTGDNSLSVFDISNPLFPVEVQQVMLRGDGNSFQLTLDAQEQYLYVVSQRASMSTPLGEGNFLHVLRIDGKGLLSEVPSSPTPLPGPLGTRPQGVVTGR